MELPLSNVSIEVVEQPKSMWPFYREYVGHFSSSLLGRNCTEQNKTFPTIRLVNAVGPVVIVVSCVTSEHEKPRPHPHNLVGKHCGQDGVCTMKVRNGSSLVSFPNLEIQYIKREQFDKSLEKREEIRVDPFQTGFATDPSLINPNEVRLCFQAFLPDREGFYRMIVPPVVSEPIKNLN